MDYIKRRIPAPALSFKIGRLALEAAKAILCTLLECKLLLAMAPTIILSNIDSVMAIVHCKHVTVNINNMKLVLDISAKIRLNYFSLIDVSDHPAPATTTHHLHAAPAHQLLLPLLTPPLLPTTTFLPPPGTIRVSTHQMAGIRVPVQFTKLVLEEQEEKKEEKKEKKKWEQKKKKEKKNDDDDENDDNDD
ncbi:hypothetical protein CISG_10306 [Coccidioides immitis RMSCC 3703]|uniref:Uncharacterized protein n=1 Tax=Coccidioides immitis RMSCC 3703 TaxID=454286 RepID=A0A0J8QP12_COCIT|nr:hypothetical protein CISG_10306 [Coccidioides immitis RMSCC 3703]